MKRNKFQANVGRMLSGTILIFILCSIQNSNSAVVNEQTLSLNSITSSGDYAARDQVILSPGFHGTASSTEAGIHIYTNPHMIVPTNYLPISSIPTDSRDLNTNLLVGSLEGNSNVSGSGAANYTIPIPVPIGIKGMQPNLSIVYNSQVGNGLLGWGCNLGGLSVISRSGKDQYHDGIASAPQYNTSDPLILDGQRLIYMSEKSGYFTEIQSHSLVTTEPNGFKLKTKDGVLYRYGSLTGKLSGAQDTVLCWYVDYVEDPMGNYMRYVYEQENLCMYIKRIEYGNNVNQETNTTHYVDFYYENRKDTISINYGLFSGKMSRIVYKIVSGTNNEIYRTLNLSYSKDVYSRLTSIKEGATDGSSFNPTILNWEYIPEDSIQSKVVSVDTLGYNADGVHYSKAIDFDGDGISELVKLYHTTYSRSGSIDIMDIRYYVKILKPNPDGNGSYSFSTIGSPFWVGQYSVCFDNRPVIPTSSVTLWGVDQDGLEKSMISDFNGDGKQDVILELPTTSKTINNVKVYFSKSLIIRDGGSIDTICTELPTSVSKIYTSGDLNNDGKSEVLFLEQKADENGSYHGKYYYSRNCSWIDFSVKSPSIPRKLSILDADADGLSDLMIVQDSGYVFVWNNGEAIVNGCKTISFSETGTGETFAKPSTKFFQPDINLATFGDFNGDGLLDFIFGSSNFFTWSAFINNGNRTFTNKPLPEIVRPENEESFGLMSSQPKHYYYILADDFNSDGKTDLIACNGDYGTKLIDNPIGYGTMIRVPDAKKISTRWYKSIGNNFELIKTSSSENEANSLDLNVVVGDYDGNGIEEMMNYSYNYDCYDPSNTTGGWKMYQNPMQIENTGKVVNITNGLNKKIEFDYQSLPYNSTNSIYRKSLTEVSYPVANIIPAVSLVKSMKTLSGGEFDETTFKYNGAKSHLAGKGFLCFNHIESFNQNHDRHIFDGFSFDSIYYNTFSDVQYIQNYEGETDISRKNYIYNISSIGNNCVLPKLTNILESDYARKINKITTNTIDDNGNLTAQTVEAKELYGATVLTVNTTNIYTTVGGGIWPNRLINTSTTNTRAGMPAISQSALYTYYNSGMVHTEQKYSGTSSLALTTYTYDTFGNPLTSVVKPFSSTNSLTTVYEYSSDGRFVTKVIDPIGTISTQKFSPLGLLKTRTDVFGKTTTYDYDAMGRSSKVTNPDGTITTSSLSWTSSPSGALFYSVNATTGKPINKVYYDAQGREIRTTQIRFDGTELSIDKKYDSRGRLFRKSLPFKDPSAVLWNVYVNDTYDRPIRIDYASGKTEIMTYSGNNVTETKDDISVTKCYDATGQLISITDPAGSIIYNLRSDGQPLSIVAPGNITTSFGYDNYGRQTSINDPSAGMKSYEYDAAGNLYRETDARNKVTTMLYDQYNRLSSKIFPEFSTTYSYNDVGLLSSIVSTNETSKVYTYDAFGRITTEKENIPGNKWLKKTYSYDSGNVTSVAYSAQSGNIATENYVYSNGNLSEIKLNGQISLWKLNTENDFGQSTQVATGPLTRNYAFNANGFPTGRTVSSSSATILNQSYGFNTQTGNLNWRRDEMRNLQENFSYDSLKRLLCAGSDTIGYDNKGNITNKQSVGAFQYDISGKPYAISGVTPYGNAIPLRNQTVSYTSFMRPDSIIENENLAELSYNAAGDLARTRLTNGQSLISDRLYAGGNYMIDITASTTKEHLFLGGDAYSAPAVYIKDGSTGSWNIYYICRDYLGSITHVTNGGGSLEQELSYDVWGRLRNPETQELYASGEEPNLFLGRGYTGHEHLREFGLINMNARLYDPSLGRFLSPDPYVQAPDLSQSFNRYSYCLNNPLKYTDPSGENWISDKIGQFQDWFDKNVGSTLRNIGITSFSVGGSVSYTPGKSGANLYGGGGVGLMNNQEIIAGYSFDNNKWGIGKNYSNPYCWGSYEAMDCDIVNGINNARGGYFDNYLSEGSMLEMADMSFGDAMRGGDFVGCGVSQGEGNVSELVLAFAGSGLTAGEMKMFNKNSWYSLKQMKTYSQSFNGNGYTGGKIAHAQTISNTLKWTGRAVGFYNAFSIGEQRVSGEISTGQMVIEEGSNLYSTFGGIYGAAWGIGWELGRTISTFDWYQDFKQKTWYPWRQKYLGY